MSVDLTVDKHSPLPVYAQIQEQIKLALLLGRLRPGDTLPSIRDVEQRAGISRNVVRKAYLALQKSGILNLRHGKGVLVEQQLNYTDHSDVQEQCETLSRDILSRLHRTGVSPSAFARYLYQQAREQENRSPFIIFVDAAKSQATSRAGNISAIWQLNVPGYSLDELAAMPKQEVKKIGRILTNYIRFDQVRRIVKDATEVIPLGLAFSEHTILEFRRLPANARIVLVLDDQDYPSLSLLLDLYRKMVLKPGHEISALPMSKVRKIQKFIRSSGYDKIIFSNRLWDNIPDDLKKYRNVTRPHMEVDLASLESARIRAGVLI